MKKNEIIQKIESKKFLAFVNQHLKENNINDNYGIYTGQSLCSLFLKFIGFSKEIIINDYDIFKLIRSKSIFEINRNNCMSFNPEDNNINFKRNLYNSSTELKFERTNYMLLRFKEKKINIYKSIKENKKNTIYCQQANEDGLFLKGKQLIKLIIQSFDINCCMIGLCLETKEIYYTNEFIDFILTKKIKIVNYRTPGISFLRLIRKMNELNINMTLKELNAEKNKINIKNILYLSKNNIKEIKKLTEYFQVNEIGENELFEEYRIDINKMKESDYEKLFNDFKNYIELELLPKNKKLVIKDTNKLIESFSKYKKLYKKLLYIYNEKKPNENLENAKDTNSYLNYEIINSYFYNKELNEKELRNFLKIHEIIQTNINIENIDKKNYYNIITKIFNLSAMDNKFQNKKSHIRRIICIYNLFELFEVFQNEDKLVNESYIKKYNIDKIKSRINYINNYTKYNFSEKLLLKIEEYKLKCELEDF